MGHQLGEDLLKLAEKLQAIASDLTSGEGAPSSRMDAATALASLDDSALAAIVLAIYRARQRRFAYFDAQLLGEPAWDMLLTLFVSRANGLPVSTTSLCVAAGVPHTTAIRAIGRLESKGLLQRYGSSGDKRVVMVELSEAGLELMRTYVTDGVLRDEMPIQRD